MFPFVVLYVRVVGNDILCLVCDDMSVSSALLVCNGVLEVPCNVIILIFALEDGSQAVITGLVFEEKLKVRGFAHLMDVRYMFSPNTYLYKQKYRNIFSFD